MGSETALDFSGREQLYSQIYDILFSDITSGVYAVGDLIPSETELMATYGVSRATARKAMELLSNNGLIRKRRGKGSEVVSNLATSSLSRVSSYMKKSLTDTVVPVKRMVDALIVPCPTDVAETLGLEPGTPMYRLRRLRFAGDEPVYFEMNFFESTFIPDAMGHDFSKKSLRAYLFTERGVKWSHALQEIYACSSDEEQSRLLGIKEGNPLLYIKRVNFDMSNTPRECVKAFFRSDLYHLEIGLDDHAVGE